MTINLVHQLGPEQAHQLLEQSFAQYQADGSVVGLVRGIERGKQMLDEIAAELGGHDAPILEYARLRARISEMERAQARASRLQRRQAASDALAALRRGDIINITHGRRGGLAVVLESARDGDDPRPLVLTEHRWAGRISSADYSGAAAPVGSMTLPKRVEHRQPRVRRDLASALLSAVGWKGGLPVPRWTPRPRCREATARFTIRNWRRCGRELRRHPAHNDARTVEDQIRADRALPAHRTRQRAAAAEGRRCHQFVGPNLRPDRRAAHRARLHRRVGRRSARSPTTAGCWPGSTARATCWSPNACAPARGRAWVPPSWRRWSRRCCTKRGAVTAPAPRLPPRRPRRAYSRRCSQTCEAVDHAARR